MPGRHTYCSFMTSPGLSRPLQVYLVASEVQWALWEPKINSNVTNPLFEGHEIEILVNLVLVKVRGRNIPLTKSKHKSIHYPSSNTLIPSGGLKGCC